MPAHRPAWHSVSILLGIAGLAAGAATLLTLRCVRSQLANANAGLFPLTTNRNNGQTTLPLLVKVKPVCRAGNLDPWVGADHRHDATDLIVSLEPWASSGKKAVSTYATINQTSLTSGMNVTLKLPDLDRPEAFGLFVCTDHAHTHHCAGKPLFATSVPGKSIQAASNGKTAAGDRLLSAQWLLIDGRTVAASRIVPWTPVARARIAEGLQAKGAHAVANLNQELASADQLLWALHSEPLELGTKQTVLQLTKADFHACAPPTVNGR